MKPKILQFEIIPWETSNKSFGVSATYDDGTSEGWEVGTYNQAVETKRELDTAGAGKTKQPLARRPILPIR